MTAMTPWPSVTDYIVALQHPQLVFHHDDLRSAVFDRDGWGAPESAAGSNAAVFRAMISGSPTAIRCFTSSAGRSGDRYQTLASHRAATNVSCLADASWTQEAITIHRNVWPVVQMEWVDGRTLDEYVKYLCEQQPNALDLLAQEWREVLEQLSNGDVAHGDLQHGNVLVDQSSALRLVDLDGVWVGSAGHTEAPEENGHPAYRHPEHVGPEFWGRWMDAFPGVLIYTTIRALYVEPTLWQRYNNGENLLFAPDDLRRPGNTPIWHDMRRLPDPEVKRLIELLFDCCQSGWRPNGTAPQMLALVEQTSTVNPIQKTIEAADGLPWHMEPQAATAPAATSLPAPPPPEAHIITTPPTPPTPATRAGTSWFDQQPSKPAPSGQPVGGTTDPMGASSSSSSNIVGWIIFILIAALIAYSFVQGLRD